MRASGASVGSALLLVAAASWGLAAAVSKYALEQLAPLDLLAVEIGGGGLVLAAMARARGVAWVRFSRPVVLLGGLEPALAFVLFDFGVDRTSASSAALLLSSESVFTVVLAVVLLRERLSLASAAGLLAAVAGSVLIAGAQSGGEASVLGDLLVLGSAGAAAGYAVLGRVLAPDRDALGLTVTQIAAAGALSAPVVAVGAISGHSRLGHVDGAHLAAAGGVALLATVVPFLLFNLAISRTPATVAALLLTLIPVLGAAAAVVLLGDVLLSAQLAGGALIIAGALAAALRG